MKSPNWISTVKHWMQQKSHGWNRMPRELREALMIVAIISPALLWACLNPSPQPGGPDDSGGAHSKRDGLAPTPGVGCIGAQEDNNGNGNEDPVYLSFGTMYLSAIDAPYVTAPGQLTTAALGFNRFYSSGDTGTEGPLGYGWTHNYHILLTDNDTSVLLKRWDGRELTFTNSGSSYTPPAGESSTLTKTGSVFYWKLAHGTLYTFNNSPYYRLASLQDRQGNPLTMTYDINSGMLTNVTDGASRRLAILYDVNNYIQKVIDPLNRTNTYAYDDYFNLRTVSDSLGAKVTYYYDHGTHTHAITRLVDARGKTNHFGYDATSRVTSETNALGATQTYTWDWANWFVKVTNYNGVWQYSDSFNSKGQQLSYTNSLGHIQYKLDGTTGLLTNYIDLMGYSTSNIWDASALTLLKSINPLGQTNTWSYHATFKKVTQFINALNRTNQYAYDAEGNLTNFIKSGYTTNRFVYDGAGNLTQSVDGNLHTNKFTFDSSGNLTGLTNALGYTNRFQYDTAGRLTNSFDALSHSTSFVWDDRDRLSRVIDANGKTNGFAYDENGNVLRATNELNQVTSYAYDNLNRLTSTTLPGGGSPYLKFGYDNMGNLTRLTNALGYTNIFTYDNANRLTALTNAMNCGWNFTNNANGWRTHMSDPSNRVTQFGYDRGGRLTSTTNALTQVVSFQYNAVNLLTNLVDGRNNNLGFEYQDCCDAELTEIRYDTTDKEKFVYDPEGNLKYYTNRANQVVSYAYDAEDRLTNKVYVSASSADTMSYKYDPANQLTNALWTMGASYTNSQLDFTYDSLGRVTAEVQKVGAASSLTVSYEYFDDGRRKKLTYPDGTYITYEYYSNGWLSAIKDNGTTNIIVSYQYDAAGNRTNRALFNNTSTSYQYDAAGRLTNLVNKSNGTNFSQYAYGYDSVGNRKWVKRLSGKGDVYTYDQIDQVTNVVYDATTPDTTPGSGTNQMRYVIDAAGNWTSRVQTNSGGSTTNTYQVSKLNQYTNINGTTYTYDSKGNLTSDGVNTYQYDYENRLTYAYVGGTVYTNAYDVLGRWIARKQSATWTRYYYAGWQLIEERNHFGTQTAKYVYGPGLDEPVRYYRTSNSTTNYYLTDGLGNITEVTDSTGALVEQYTYDIYGTPTIRNSGGTVIASSAIANRWQFTGRDWDAGQRLYQYRLRHYSPSLGRFMQTDPINVAGGLNLYSYVDNNPINYIDIFGLDCTKASGKSIIDIPEFVKMPNGSIKLIFIPREQDIRIFDISKLFDKLDELTGGLMYGNMPPGFLIAGVPRGPKGFIPVTKLGGRITEPKLPSRTIVDNNGVRIEHFYRSGDYGPAHLHITGGGSSSKIGQAGKPIAGSPELSAIQKQVVRENKSAIRKTIDQIQRWFRFENTK